MNEIDSNISKEREKVTSFLEKTTPIEIEVTGASEWEHTALYDCAKELRMLNSTIAMAHAIPKLSLE